MLFILGTRYLYLGVLRFAYRIRYAVSVLITSVSLIFRPCGRTSAVTNWSYLVVVRVLVAVMCVVLDGQSRDSNMVSRPRREQAPLLFPLWFKARDFGSASFPGLEQGRVASTLISALAFALLTRVFRAQILDPPLPVYTGAGWAQLKYFQGQI